MIDIDDYTADELWCGVFQGGGARGVAYAGALAALHARHHWFAAVAGSSAGAITAALVAAGLEPDRIRAETPRLLAAVSPTPRSIDWPRRSGGTASSATTAAPSRTRWIGCWPRR